MDESLIGEGGKEKEKGRIIGKGVGQFHDDIKEVNHGKIFQQTNDVPKFRCDGILGISKETPILEVLEKEFGNVAEEQNHKNNYRKHTRFL